MSVSSTSRLIKSWINSQGVNRFTYADIDKALGIVTPNEKNVRRVVFFTLLEAGIIRRLNKQTFILAPKQVF